MSVFLLLLSAFIAGTDSTADSLLSMAETAESGSMYLTADSLYRRASSEYSSTGEHEMADLCRFNSYRMQWITAEHPYTRAQADSIFMQTCPWLSASERNAYFEADKVDCLVYEGSVYYFYSCIMNVLFRDLELMREYGRRNDRGDPFYDALQDIILRPPDSGYPHQPWQQEINPLTFLVEGSMTWPENELPESGILYLWIPVPIQSSDQENPRIISVTPEEYVIYPPSTDCELGTVYMEIPLDSIEGDLVVSVKSIHTHYERSCIVDQNNVGSYNTEDPSYRLYTEPNPNIVFTPEIAALAREIVGEEENPYLQARLIYDYIVSNIPYSHTPHASLSALDIPESVFCHENGHGDCGTQSMYFCALCRSLGIPARACGGYQLVPGVTGTHFWAEFMLPDYGWIPVDVTVAETADFSWSLTDEEIQVFKDYFFGNLDPYRMVIQKDVSIPLSPAPINPVVYNTAIQFPIAVCSESPIEPCFATNTYWKMEVTPVQR